MTDLSITDDSENNKRQRGGTRKHQMEDGFWERRAGKLPSANSSNREQGVRTNSKKYHLPNYLIFVRLSSHHNTNPDFISVEQTL